MKKKLKFHNLKSRYSMVSVVAISVCIAIFSVVQFVFMDDIFLYTKKEDMKKVAEEIKLLDFSNKDYMTVLADIENRHNFYIEIYSPRDKLFYTTKANDAVYDKTDSTTQTELKPRIMKILSRNELEDGNYFEMRQEYFATAEYIVYGTFFGESNGLEIYTSIDVVKENAQTASNALFILSLFILFTIFIVSSYYATLFTNPIRQITDITKKMAKLDFVENCPPFAIKELDELSENINTLSDKLDKALNKLKEENIQLEKDIRFERKMEKSRKSFVANVSHELKTPISIIQGYAEALKYGIISENTDETYDIIIEESEKMNQLVTRIMEYVHYGSGAFELKNEQFNIKALVRTYFDSLSHGSTLSQEAQVSINIDERFNGYGDKQLITHVFSNYFSNALAHLDFEKQIKINAVDIGNAYRISVFNTGNPISGSDIENIWQSFYRADKAHSRQEGRFGLGLSIVASIQELHKQKYGVKNKDNGVEFWFDIEKPKSNKT